MAPQLDQEVLKALLLYLPDEGIFIWHPRAGKKAWNTKYAGKVAGFDWHAPNSNVTYRSIRIFDWPFMGHRLAWLYMTGEWPKIGVDHRDGDGLNNKWDNLREATKAQNGANAGAKSNNKAGRKGVSLDKATGRFRATIQVERKWMWLGYFATVDDAAEAYNKASLELHGEFRRSG